MSTGLHKTVSLRRPRGDESKIAATEQIKCEVKMIRYVHSGASSSNFETILPVAEQITGTMILE